MSVSIVYKTMFIIVGIVIYTQYCIPYDETHNVNTLKRSVDEYTCIDDYSGTGGGTIVMHNNVYASPKKYSTVLRFILEDTTDKRTYVEDVYQCSDFAVEIHDNAEMRGIESGIVALELRNGADVSYHAINVFNTTDRGLVYFDCTGIDQEIKDHLIEEDFYFQGGDTRVYPVEDEKYRMECLWYGLDEYVDFDDDSVVDRMTIYW